MVRPERLVKTGEARMQEEDEGNKEQWLDCSWSLEVGSFLMKGLGNISPPGSDWKGGGEGGGRVW